MYSLSMMASLIFVVLKTPHLINVVYQKYKSVTMQETSEANIYSQFEVEFLGLHTVKKARRGDVSRIKSMFNKNAGKQVNTITQP